MRWLVPVAACLACTPAEPLELPADPAAFGVPIGVRTVEVGDLTAEVWYPAPDATAEQPTEMVDWSQFLEGPVTDLLGEVELTQLEGHAVRDAPVRRPESPYPVLVFSHGLGGTRVQSVDLTAHLASRGYVVLAADHPGRSLPDLLPCLFLEPPEGCDLSGFAFDPAVPHVGWLVDWIEIQAEDGFLEGAIDPERVGLLGHSAGGVTTVSAGALDERFDALLPMAGGGSVGRDVPVLRMTGTCDGTVAYEDQVAAHDRGDLLAITGAGHHAFSDICQLGLAPLAEQLLVPRDDVNRTLLDGMLLLAADGCPGYPPTVDREECTDTWLDVDVSRPIVRHEATVFFDAALRGVGDGVVGDSFPEATLNP